MRGRRRLGDEEEHEKNDRLAVGRVERGASAQAHHGGGGFLETLDATVRYRHATTETGRADALAREQILDHCRGGHAVPPLEELTRLVEDRAGSGSGDIDRDVDGGEDGEEAVHRCRATCGTPRYRTAYQDDIKNAGGADRVHDAKEQVAGIEAMARQLGPQLQAMEVGAPADFEAAFTRIRDGRMQGLLAFATNTIGTHRARLAALASAAKLPTITDFGLLVQAGFLMSYGADLGDLTRRSATYVSKILRGARPGELAIERPSKFVLGINLKTAAAIGLAIPQSLLQRADEVIR